LMKFGSMEDLLIRDRKFLISRELSGSELIGNIRTQTQILVDASAGIQHLHSKNVVHRDIAARNFLVDHNHRGYVSDFGMSRRLEKNCSFGVGTSGELLPVAWCAPETLTSWIYSFETDVYMFGMFLYEVGTRCPPFSGLSAYDIGSGVTSSPPLRPDIRLNCPSKWAELMKKCWDPNPSQRITMTEMTNGLREYLAVCQSTEDGYTLLPSCINSLPERIEKPMDGQSHYGKGYEPFESRSSEEHPWDEFYKARRRDESKKEEIRVTDGDVNQRLQQALLALETEKERADGEKARADKEKERADQANARADREKERADREKERADALEGKFSGGQT